MSKKVLVVGLLHEDKWIGNLIRHIKSHNNSISFDFFNAATIATNYSSCVSLCSNVYYSRKHFPSIFYKIPKVSSVCQRLDVSISFHKFIKDKKKENEIYDLVNFHYLTTSTLRYWKSTKEIAKHSLLSPWGSDVLRCSPLTIYFVRKYVAN